MRTMVLILPRFKNIESYLEKLNALNFKNVQFTESEVHIEGKNQGFVEISKLNSLLDSYDEEELSLIPIPVSELSFYQIKFDLIDLVKNILSSCFHDEDVFIDDDFNDIVTGIKFKQLIECNPCWDWRDWQLQGFGLEDLKKD